MSNDQVGIQCKKKKKNPLCKEIMKGDVMKSHIIIGGVQILNDYAIFLIMKVLKLMQRNHYAEL